MKQFFGGVLLLLTFGWCAFLLYRIIAHLPGLAPSLWIPSLILVGCFSYVGARLVVLGKQKQL